MGKKIGIGCGVIVGILILIIIIGLAAGDPKAGGGESVKKAADPAKPPVEVTARELFAAYEANEAAAQQTYGDQPLLVSGTISAIELDALDDPVVRLATSNQFMSATANLTEESQKQASSLAKGAKIKLLCSDVSEVVGMPQLKDCEIQ